MDHNFLRRNTTAKRFDRDGNTREQIYARHPWQFRAGKANDGCVPPDWLPVIINLCDQVADAIQEAQRADFYWTDVKGKRGRLRDYYVGPGAIDLGGLIDRAEDAIAVVEGA